MPPQLAALQSPHPDYGLYQSLDHQGHKQQQLNLPLGSYLQDTQGNQAWLLSGTWGQWLSYHTFNPQDTLSLQHIHLNFHAEVWGLYGLGQALIWDAAQRQKAPKMALIAQLLHKPLIFTPKPALYFAHLWPVDMIAAWNALEELGVMNRLTAPESFLPGASDQSLPSLLAQLNLQGEIYGQ